MTRFASILAVAALALSACNRDPDARAQKLLVGTWSMTSDYESGDTSTTTITFGPNGKYDCRVVGRQSGKTFDLQGTWQVQNGVVTDIMTNTSARKLTQLLVSHYPIVRIDSREMLMRWETNGGWTYATNEPLFRKISK